MKSFKTVVGRGVGCLDGFEVLGLELLGLLLGRDEDGRDDVGLELLGLLLGRDEDGRNDVGLELLGLLLGLLLGRDEDGREEVGLAVAPDGIGEGTVVLGKLVEGSGVGPTLYCRKTPK